MWRFLMTAILVCPAAAATTTHDIGTGMGASGWCKGFDLAPNDAKGKTPNAEPATDAADCFSKCQAAHPTTIAVDFWDVNDANRNDGNICWCQDKCDCLAAALPVGTGGKLVLDESTPYSDLKSCGYDFFEIKEAETEHGWCKSPLDSAPGGDAVINNAHDCVNACKDRHKGSVAADFFKRDGKGVCFCQSECPCRMASKPGGGDGILAMMDDTKPSKNMCYKITAASGAQGFCPGFDKKPSDTSAKTAAECFDKCKATDAATVAVDFFPKRDAGTQCWCQNKCDCTRPTKADGGNGVLFVAEGTTKGHSCAGKCDCIEPEEGKWLYKMSDTADAVEMSGGCVVTPDSPEQSWCYVKDTTCMHAKKSSITGESRFWRQCDASACRSDWINLDTDGDASKNTHHSGCQPSAEWGAWCYTQGAHAYSSPSMDSLDEKQFLDWANCDTCACQHSWLYERKKGEGPVLHHNCFDDKDWEQKWCYVEGAANCHGPIGVPSAVEGEGRHYRICGRETCADHKAMFKKSECCGSPTKKWPLQMVQ